MSNAIFDLHDIARKDDMILYSFFDKINGVISKHHIKEYKKHFIAKF